MRIRTARFVFRDVREDDRSAFITYQLDPRYRKLYDLDENPGEKASALLSEFLAWQDEEPRRRERNVR